MLRNWILGFLAISIWTTNYLVYFAPDIRAWHRRRRQQQRAQAGWGAAPARPWREVAGPLPPQERRNFPPPEPPPHPVQEAEIIPFPERPRQAKRG